MLFNQLKGNAFLLHLLHLIQLCEMQIATPCVVLCCDVVASQFSQQPALLNGRWCHHGVHRRVTLIAFHYRSITNGKNVIVARYFVEGINPYSS